MHSPEPAKPLTPLGWVDSFAHTRSFICQSQCAGNHAGREHRNQQGPSLPSRTSQPRGSRVWSSSALGRQPPMGQSSVRTDSDPDRPQVRERTVVPGPTSAAEPPCALLSLLPGELGVEPGVWIPHPGFAIGFLCGLSQTLSSLLKEEC